MQSGGTTAESPGPKKKTTGRNNDSAATHTHIDKHVQSLFDLGESAGKLLVFFCPSITKGLLDIPGEDETAAVCTIVCLDTNRTVQSGDTCISAKHRWKQ